MPAKIDAVSGEPLGLGRQQRNLYLYAIAHFAKFPNSPCFVPRVDGHCLEKYIKAIDRLEELGLLKVVRCEGGYRQWVLRPGGCRG